MWLLTDPDAFQAVCTLCACLSPIVYGAIHGMQSTLVYSAGEGDRDTNLTLEEASLAGGYEYVH